MKSLDNKEKKERVNLVKEAEDGEPPINNREVGREDCIKADDEEESYKNNEEGNMYSTISARRAVVLPTKEEVEATCAKWCRMLEDGRCQWDRSKIKCLLSEDELNDPLLVRNLIHGTIVSSRVHPLIFETSKEEDDQMVRFRSLPFFNQLLVDGENGISMYQSLSSEQKLIIAVGVRDLYLSAWNGMLSDQEKRLLNGMVKIVDETVGCFQVMGMNISFHPSANFKVLKLIEMLDDAVGDESAPLFAQVMQGPKLFIVFVDPVELSFHNFENIIPLDFWIERKLENEGHGELSLLLANVHQVRENREVFTCKLQGAQIIYELSSLDLYVAPLNKATRGGERFIFHSALLCKALSKAIVSSDILDKLARGSLGSSFEFVNYVFRCNRFATQDAIFASHLDTPYYDGARSQVSKYTLLIYLTGGHNEPALRIGDVDLNEIEEMTCVIFDQSYEHEGSPFIEGNKRFIRSELVFTDKLLDHNSQIASLFSEACYMTGQSAFDEGLTSYAHDCFERANLLHWAIEKEATQPPVYLQKQFHEITFVTNGYNYWFANGCGVNVVDCGMVAVLDYFNCKIGGQSFRSLCSTMTIRKRFDKMENIWKSLRDGRRKAETFRRMKESDVESLFDKGIWNRFFSRGKSWSYDDENKLTCCPAHFPSTFDVWKSPAVKSLYAKCCNYTRRKLFGAPLMVFDQELVINDSNIKIVGDKIFFLKGSNSEQLPRINFAGCWEWDEEEREFIGLDQEIPAPQFLIPPIMFRELDHGYQLVLDFFRNDWMVRVENKRTIPVPTVLDKATLNETPFFDKTPYYYQHSESRNYDDDEDLSQHSQADSHEPFKIFEDDEDFRTFLLNRYKQFDISEDDEDSDSLRAN